MAKMSSSVSNTLPYSAYYYVLDKTAKTRYREKLRMLGEMEDPYITSSKIHTDDAECLDWLKWPDVEYGDIFNYCITSPNGYSQEELKAYKSLDAYKFFVDGWVSDILVWVVPSQPKACVVTGRVRHSQKMLDDPLQPWVAVEKKGLVICAHCTCTAGLGEACSHVAALLFLLEANSQMKKSLSCTSQPCYWLPPSFKNVPYAEVCDVDFTSAPKKLKKLTSQTTCTSKLMPKVLLLLKLQFPKLLLLLNSLHVLQFPKVLLLLKLQFPKLLLLLNRLCVLQFHLLLKKV